MPELPEVETMRRGLLGVEGGRIEAILPLRTAQKPIALRPSSRRLRAAAEGQTIQRVDRIGKRVVLRLADGSALVFEPRMTGLLLVADPPNQSHLRLHVRLAGARVTDFWYWDRRGLGVVTWLAPRQIESQLGATRIGPDALQVSPAELQSRLGKTRRDVKVALLDQKYLAGVGNLYASELLHRARVHPQHRCDRLGIEEWRRIHRALRQVLLAAIRAEGSTLADGTYRTALNRDGSYQNRHRVYQKTGTPCQVCGTANIVRIVQAQRATFYCPRCQPKRRQSS